jgi:undecaprenyl phosphate N,N'-diacetylbacillosamine 1-phosphate transferase
MSRKTQLGMKRVLDLLLAASGLVVLSPFFVLTGIVIMLDSPGPVFFAQERAGLLGRRFRMLKFRSMVEDAARLGSGLYVAEDDTRITRVGRILRRFSLDELPQLLNILTGEMSLVGPRPALLYHVERYTDRQARRLLMRPGLTGWSQVNGRNLLSWPERLERDVWYVDRFSLLLDARILFRTPAVWFSGAGLYGEREKFYFSGQDDIPAPSKRNS